MNLQEKKKIKVLKLAKKCPSRIRKLIQKYFIDETIRQDLMSYLVAQLDYSSKERFLQDAIRNNLVSVVRLYLLITSLNVNSAMGNGDTTYLNYAVLQNRKPIVECLLNLGAHIDVEDYFGLTALHTALGCARTKIAQILLYKKYNVILSDALEVIKFLIDKPGDFYTKDGCSALLCYACQVSKEGLELVLSVSPVKDIFVRWPESFPGVDSDLLTFLIREKPSKGQLKLVIEKINNEDRCSGQPAYDVITMAVFFNPKTIPILLGKAIPGGYMGIRYEHRKSIQRLFYFIKKKIVIHILERSGIDVYQRMPSDQNELHHWCFYEAGIELFLYEMEKGVNINQLNKKKQTPLKFAINKQHINNGQSRYLVSILVKMIANNEFINEVNWVCLEHKYVKKFYEICKQELSRLKRKRLTESLSYYDLLTGNLKKLTQLARRRVIPLLSEQDLLEFPIYSAHLERNVDRSLWRLREINRIYKITYPWVPELITDNICGYLNDKELRRSKYYFTLLVELLNKINSQNPSIML